MSAADRGYLEAIARATWTFFDELVGPEDNFLPPDNVQVRPERMVAHRTSPTNIGLGLLSTLAAHDLEFIDTPQLLRRIDQTLTTIEGLEKFEGHLFNWYDTRTLAPLPPAYVSTVDSGNLAAACVTVASALRDSAPSLAARATALFDAMDFRFLFDRKRQLLAIGYQAADSDVAGRLDPRTTICWLQRPGSRVSWRLPKATSPRRTGSTSDGQSPACVVRRRCSPGAPPCSST